jgi:hypothetical protein
MLGLNYPLQTDGNGGLSVVSEEDLVKSRIDALIDTLPGESPMRPRYGIESPIFDSQSDWNTYAFSILQKLRQEIPDAEFGARAQIADDGSAVITITYAYRGVPQEDFLINFSA